MNVRLFIWMWLASMATSFGFDLMSTPGWLRIVLMTFYVLNLVRLHLRYP